MRSLTFLLTVIFLGSWAPGLMAQHITFMSHILSYTGYAVAPRKQRQDLATLWRGLQGEGRRPFMGTARCPSSAESCDPPRFSPWDLAARLS